VVLGVLRKAALLAALAACFVPGAASAATSIELVPGLTYTRDVRTIGAARVVVHILTAPKPGGLFALKPVLSNETIAGRETVSGMQRRLSRRATLAGVNGDLFNWNTGHPSGIFLRDNVLASRAWPRRSSLGIGLDGLLRTGLIRSGGRWQVGSHPAHPLREFNRPLAARGVALFSPTWGRHTPYAHLSREVILSNVARVGPNKELVGKVVARRLGSGHAIPRGGAVLQARGFWKRVLFEEARIGHWVQLEVDLSPWWSEVRNAIGGGPLLVNAGAAVLDAGEEFSVDQLAPRNPRTAAGQLGDGRIILVAIDGRSKQSAGVTNRQLARLMVDLGAVTAIALDAGGSTTIAFDGRVMNRPSDGHERAVGDALMILYYGVYTRPPRLAVYSPNGDGVADVQRLYAKVVRPAQVTLKLLRVSDGFIRWSSTKSRSPGTVVKDLTSSLHDGKWRWVATAVDSAGRTSQMDRTFTVNKTLGFLTLSKTLMRPTVAHGGRLGISFRLAHPAKVTVTIRRPGGTIVRRLLTRSDLSSGAYKLLWNARNGAGNVVRNGTYVVHVRATNSIGTVVLTKSVRVLRRS
jgi:Phosphodiester glycosidase/FlgD Ig-like domain